MLINKKLLSLTNLNWKFYITLFTYKNTLCIGNHYFNNNIVLLKPNYTIQFLFIIKAKFLFILTIYILLNYINLFKLYLNYHCRILPKRKKIITILRAPCNHKNSKEQFMQLKYKINILITSEAPQTYFYKKYLLLYLEKYVLFYSKFTNQIIIN
jgi:hypothetical protein